MDTPRNLYGDIDRTRQEMEHLVQQVFGQTLSGLRPLEGKWHPNVDVFETEDNVVVVVELAGIAREDVSVVFHDGKLYVSGIRKDDIPYKSRKYRQMEISYDEFQRVIYMPENIDVEKISAKLNNGFMIILAPRKKPEGPKTVQWR